MTNKELDLVARIGEVTCDIEEDIVRLKDALSKKEDELKRLEENDSEL